ncbi:MAG: ROK family protein [Chthoniobacterales bacterium]
MTSSNTPVPVVPTLDRGFQPLGPGQGDGVDFKIALEREGGAISTFSARLSQGDAETRRRHAERLTKFFLWSRGGWRLHVWAEDSGVAAALAEAFRPGGARAFDVDLMSRVYGREFVVVPAETPADVPGAVESEKILGGNLDRCRIGFDLGASDYKVAAVRNGEAVYSDEFPWNPKDQADPEYLYQHLNEGLRRAAEHLPRVDAIGGSSAGVIVDNRFMVASLLRSIPEDKLPQARNLFLRLREEWGVPLEVANDGDVTALAGAMSLGVTGLLGIAMGSSEAAGYINPAGKMTGWLNELAFAPVDLNPEAAADEWSGDRGVGALYFSQQAVNKLLPAAGVPVAAELTLPERLKQVQALMAEETSAARSIYETIGVYLGHALPLYAGFYDIRHVLVLGRVTTGRGGGILLDQAREVLRRDYPELSGQIELHLPDEKSRRVGQAVAAASLPSLNV